MYATNSVYTATPVPTTKPAVLRGLKDRIPMERIALSGTARSPKKALSFETRMRAALWVFPDFNSI